MKTVNEFFENVENFNYFGTMVQSKIAFTRKLRAD
jgi:hypothetical protein